MTLRCLSGWCQFVLDNLWNPMVCFQQPSLLIGKVWVPVMHFCVCPIHCSALESEQEASIMQIDFSAAFDRVNHHGILYKLCFVGIVGSVLSILTQFLSNRSQHVIMDGCRVNWLTLHQECQREVFWARYCSSCTLQSFFSFWKIS